MRPIRRLPLDPEAQTALETRQNVVLQECQAAEFSATAEWKNARTTKLLESVHATLKRMMGDRERCMYCSLKGIETVILLQLDRREALASGYKKTYRRLASLVENALEQDCPAAPDLISALREADDHGLLGWCFGASGQNEKPFCDLRSRFPEVWDHCATQFKQF